MTPFQNRTFTIGLILLIFLVLIFNKRISGFRKTIVVQNKIKKYRKRHNRIGKNRSYEYEIYDVNGNKYETSDALGEQVKPGSVLSVKGYKSLFLRVPIITDIL